MDYSNKPGRNIDSAGMNAMIKRQMTMTATNGSTPTATCSNLTLPTLEATNRLTPSGGVTKPIASDTTSTTPKWTGSMPTEVTTGSRIGVKMINAEIVSMNMPTIKSRMMMMTSMKIGFEVRFINPSAIVFGICSSVMKNANDTEKLMMIIVVALMSMVSMKESYMPFQSSSLCMKAPTMIA